MEEQRDSGVAQLPWIEKYRPEKLAEVVGQKGITARLESYVKNRTMPNLMFSGPAGVGKTSCAVALAKEIFGQSFQQNFLELNASVTGDTPILVKADGKIKRTNFEDLSKNYFQGAENYAIPTSLQTLSVDRNNIVRFMPISLISRHKAEKIAKIKFEGGEISTSLNHSVIVIDSYGNLAAKECKDLQKGEILLSFDQEVPSGNKGVDIDFDNYPLQMANKLRSGLKINPKISVVLGQYEFDDELAWLCGLYLAEGCTGFNEKGSSGITIFTLAYPKENKVAEKVVEMVSQKFGFSARTMLGKSGFDRTRESSIQVRVLSTQLAKFFRQNFYSEGSEIKRATTKRVPSFVYDAGTEQKISFLKGYMGDAWGEWGKTIRYSSVSQENLIDIAWLAKTCGLNVSLYNKELRIVWKQPSYSYIKSELLPAGPFIDAFKRESTDYMYFFRHALYYKKSKRISKSRILEFFGKLPVGKRLKLARLEQIARSGLYGAAIKSIKISEYTQWVYDFSVPGSEMFFGGTTPILLHNSDERGIDVVRETIKDFARTLAFDSGFKIIFLDESDALTNDAQQALRRTMEKYSRTCRFILSCNYSSKILEPIQSRCVVYRFSHLSAKEVEARAKFVAEKEGAQIDQKALEAIVYVSEGDLRKAVNVLQASSSLGEKVTEKVVYDVSSRARPEEVKQMIQLALAGKFLEARAALDKLMYEHGMSGEDVIVQLHRELVGLDEKEVPGNMKIELLDKVGEYNFRLVEGANERIQLEALLAQFMKARE